MTAAHYKDGHHPGNDLGLHYTALPPIVASCPYSDPLLVTRKFWSPGANRPSQARATDLGAFNFDALRAPKKIKVASKKSRCRQPPTPVRERVANPQQGDFAKPDWEMRRASG